MPVIIVKRPVTPPSRPLEPTMAHVLPIVGTWKAPVFWIKPSQKVKFDDKQLELLIDLGFRTALNSGFDCSDILIRGAFHEATRFEGRNVIDRCHVSYGLKHAELFNNEFVAVHGYTPEKWDIFLTDSSQDTPKSDDQPNRAGHAVWPKDVVRLPAYMNPSDMKGVRNTFVKRAKEKLEAVVFHPCWNVDDDRDLVLLTYCPI